MLPNHAPLAIAEQFGTLAALFPGRIDLGVGRAPGTDQAARALRRNLASDENQFPRDVLELMAISARRWPTTRCAPSRRRARHADLDLGSSLFGAQLAAMLGLPYAFASHFAPAQMMDAIRVYREQFQPSEPARPPYVMLGFNIFAADTDEEARLLATSMQQAFVNLRAGKATQLPPPVPGFADTLPMNARLMLNEILSCSAIGNRETVREAVNNFVERTGADELMITSQIYDPQARLRSYALLSDAMEMVAA